MVPISRRLMALDIARRLKLPTIIVARATLGTINHTLLTLHAARSCGVRVLGVIINNYQPESATLAEETNPEQIAKFGKVPVLAVIGYDEQTSVEACRLGPTVLHGIKAMNVFDLIHELQTASR